MTQRKQEAPHLSTANTPSLARPSHPPYPLDVLPTTRQHGPSYDARGLLFWPRGTSSWSEFFKILLFTGDGLGTVALFSVLVLILYRLFGNPIETCKEDKRIERDKLWNAHMQRFTKGERGSEHFVGAERHCKSDLGLNQEEIKENLSRRAKILEKIKVITVVVDLEHGRSTKVTMVGDKSSATLSIVTHHDICTNFRHGLLPFSMDVIADLQLKCEKITGDRNKENGRTDLNSHSYTKLNHESLCFYHISAPGHMEGDADQVSDEELKSLGGWTMDSLAGRMNQIIAALGISGRCIFLGEGAGANICLRAACEEASRPIQKYPTKKIIISGITLISPECGAPTVGNHYTAMFAAALFRYWRYYGGGNRSLEMVLGLFGTPQSVLWNDGYLTSMLSLNLRKVIQFAEAFYTGGMRTRIRKDRARSLKNVPNLVLCTDTSESKFRAHEVAELLDQCRGSGVLAIPVKSYVCSRYVAGAGVLLGETSGRAGCVEAMKLFLEATL